MIFRPKEVIYKAVRRRLRNKTPFRIEVQNTTIQLFSDTGDIKTKSDEYSIEELNFIKAVKHHIIKNELYLPYQGKRVPKVTYFQYGKKVKQGNHYENVANIDITGAYWQTAYMLGLLPEHLYQKGLEPAVYEDHTYMKNGKEITKRKVVSGTRKQVRLAAIGSLAKKKKVYTYDGVNERQVEVIRSEKTEVLWDVICNKVGQCLVDVARACGDDFIFFWVDGVYVNKRATKKVIALFKKWGYESKVNQLKSIDVTEKNIFVNLATPEVYFKNGVEMTKIRKPFPMRRRGKKKKGAK